MIDLQEMGNNTHIVARLEGIRKMLIAVHQAGSTMSSASCGAERAAFVDGFLRKIFTPQFRFGDGDATDHIGNRSGQLDVVVEYPWVPSIPLILSDHPRLYLAEGVAAVIEVKSDVSKQWSEVIRTSKQLKKLKRQYGPGISDGFGPPPEIPLFVVGYTGWKTMKPLQARLDDGIVQGILVIDSGLFASVSPFHKFTLEGDWSLWGLISCLHQVTSTLSTMASNVPVQYL